MGVIVLFVYFLLGRIVGLFALRIHTNERCTTGLWKAMKARAMLL